MVTSNDNITLPADAPCPCRSGRAIARCGCFRGGWLVVPETQIRRLVGDFKHPKCYARDLGGCSRQLSLEHYLSHAVQRLIAGDDGMIRIHCTRFDRKIPAGTCGSNVLCEAHNNCLSVLDEVGVRLFSTLREHGPKLETRADAGLDISAFNGLDVERWMLKVLIGAANSGIVETDRGWAPPLQWVRLLFGRRGMPSKMGLWLSADRPGQMVKWEHGANFAAIWDTNSEPREVAGLLMTLAGFEFRLLMRPKGHLAGRSMPGLFRPRAIRTELPGTGREAMVVLGWPASGEMGRTLNTTWGRKPSS